MFALRVEERPERVLAGCSALKKFGNFVWNEFSFKSAVGSSVGKQGITRLLLKGADRILGVAGGGLDVFLALRNFQNEVAVAQALEAQADANRLQNTENVNIAIGHLRDNLLVISDAI